MENLTFLAAVPFADRDCLAAVDDPRAVDDLVGKDRGVQNEQLDLVGGAHELMEERQVPGEHGLPLLPREHLVPGGGLAWNRAVLAHVADRVDSQPAGRDRVLGGSALGGPQLAPTDAERHSPRAAGVTVLVPANADDQILADEGIVTLPRHGVQDNAVQDEAP